jgi:hypothetical protein
MKIVRSIAQDGNVYPSVYNYLSSLPTTVLHHTDHDLRHPLGIYGVSLIRVTNAFSDVLDEYAKLSEVPISEDGGLIHNYTSLVTAQTELLSSLQAHIDDSYLILKALHPPIKKSVIFADKWLAEAKHPSASNYIHLIKPYRDSFAPIVSKIKHEHGRLRAIWMYNPTGLHIGGYFLEGVDKSGTLGPDMRFHGGNTAISLNRDLRYHFAYLYVIDYRLMEAIITALRKTYNYTFPPSIRVEKNSEHIERVAERINQLPFIFFQDEVSKPTPIVLFHKDKGDAELTLHVNSAIKASGPIGQTRVKISYESDGVAKSWKLIYPSEDPFQLGLRARILNS